MHFDIQEILQRNPMLLRKARFLNLAFDLFVGAAGFRFSVVHGGASLTSHAAASTPPPDPSASPASPATFAIHAPEDAWHAFADAARKPQFHDLIAMVECGHAFVSGDMLPFFRNLFIVKGLLSAAFRGDAAW